MQSETCRLRWGNWILVFAGLLSLSACGGENSTEGSESGAISAADSPAFDLRDRSRDSGLDHRQASGTSSQSNIVEVKAIGSALLDYDGDGRLDLFLTAGSDLERLQAGRPGFGSKLYRNLGGLRFEDVTEKAGIPATGWSCGAIASDYDGDGDPDLYITQFGANLMLENREGRFVDVTEKSGLGDTGWGTSAVFDDFDGDGDLDLYLCNYLEFDPANPPRDGEGGRSCRWKGEEVMCGPMGLSPQPDRIFENAGDGIFRDRSQDWGLAEVEAAYALGVVSGDFDDDGQLEIYVANDGNPNSLFEWTGDQFEETGYFKAVAFGEGGASQAGMGLDAADLNGDGIEDFICSNFSNEVNNIYLSVDAEGYEEGALTTGTAQAGLKSLGWGVAFRDFDLDGQLDLFVANGHVYPQAAGKGTGTDYRQANLLMVGRPGPRFELLEGRSFSGLRPKKVSRAASFGDLDNDGDIDIVVTNLNDRPTLIETVVNREKTGRHFVAARLIGPGKNRDGIGARVQLLSEDGATVLGMRRVRRQSSFQASQDPRVHFGVPKAQFSSDRAQLKVRWSDGLEEIFEVSVDGYAKIEHGKGESR